MPKFLVTSGTSFQPFSYGELAAPVQQTAELHRATQDAYDAINLDSSAIAQYINPDLDPNASSLYNDYMTKLGNLQNNLWANGYNAGTRRDLAAAKAGYASDILRLQKAITDRQTRSSEYHNYIHEHPDAVMGEDPGLSSLDRYLENDRYGNDYFNYSGNAFTQEVGVDAQARVNELFDKYGADLERIIPGYYTFKVKEGVTSTDVAKARDAVLQNHSGEGSTELYDSLDPVQKILADVLESHLTATGAEGQISKRELNRLINYGADGLSQAIGKTDYQHLNDWQSQLALQHQYAMEEDAFKAALSGSGKEENDYSVLDTIPSEVRGQGYDKFSREFAFNSKKYPDGKVTINTPGGGAKQYDNMVSLAMDVYNPEVRSNTMKNMHVDVAMDMSDLKDSKDKEFDVPVIINGQPSTVRMIAQKPDRSQVEKYGMGADEPIIFTWMKNGKVEVNEAFTREYNKRRNQYQQHVNAYEDANKGGENLSNLVGALNPSKETKLRKQKGYGYNIPTEDIYHLEALHNYMGTRDHALLVTRGEDSLDNTRGDMANNMITIYNRMKNSGNIDKGSMYRFEIIGKGNQPTGEYTTDINDILGVKGDATNADGLSVIEVAPEDLLYSETDNYPKIRIQGEGNNTMTRTTAMYLGTKANNALLSIQDDINKMMEPIVHPEAIYSWTNEDIREWSNRMYAALNSRDDLINARGDVSRLKGPKLIDESGRGYVPTPRQIIQNEGLQAQLWSAANDLIQETLSAALGMKLWHNVQARGNTSANPSPIIQGY